MRALPIVLSASALLALLAERLNYGRGSFRA